LGAQKRVQRVAVIGAGIQGIGLSLELAARGMSVDLHEKTNRVHASASRANEGKVHLG
jgi:glycerol-3-phosphate dehydrogenase